jgi:hypothetical protein
MTRNRLAFFVLVLALAGALAPAPATAENVEVSLSGSRASMVRQNRIAKSEAYSFLRTPIQVRRFVDDGRLVVLRGNGNYRLANVGYPYARPVVQAFVERLAQQYHTACGEPLVVTSLTRPANRQPRNASPLSVHPAGMAVDLRVPTRTSCRNWLTKQLLSLEEQGVIDATRERNPPHFHVAVFPGAYADFEHTVRTDSANVDAVTLAKIAAREAELAAEILPAAAEAAAEESGLAEPAAPLLLRIAALLTQLVLPIMV